MKTQYNAIIYLAQVERAMHPNVQKAGALNVNPDEFGTSYWKNQAQETILNKKDMTFNKSKLYGPIFF